MTQSRPKLHFGAFLYTPGTHSAGWRHPDAVPATDMDFPCYLELARTAERGKLDTIFLQDTAAIGGSGGLDGPVHTGLANGRQVHLEPVSLIAGAGGGDVADRPDLHRHHDL